MLKKKRILFIAAFLTLSLFLVACGDDGETGTTPTDDAVTEDAGDTAGTDTGGAAGGGVGVSGYADELIVIVPGEIPVLDPHRANVLSTSQVNVHTLSTLVNQSADMEIYGNLATDWEMIDDRTWKFDLRDDVYFQNGDKMTAYHVAF